MQTLRSVADLLENATCLESLAPIAAAAGCPGDPHPLDDDARRALGLTEAVQRARVATGPGALRALLVDVDSDHSLRELLPKLAARLSTRASHVLWLIVARRNATDDVAIAAWTSDRHPPRVAALIAQRTRIVDSDAETVRGLAPSPGDADVITHARWIEALGREALTARFYRALETTLQTLADSGTVGTRTARLEIALLNVSRLLFLSFLEAKGWLDADRAFIANQFDACMASGGRFHQRVLRPLFFGTLNTAIRERAPRAKAFGRIPFLNGGLFSRAAVEREHRELSFSDEAYGALIAHVFGQYRFTAREETSTWNEAAVDPEMLGRAFESLMAAPERRRTGAFYTPFSLVDAVTSAGLDAVLGADRSRARFGELRILDPACGSGAFLVHALEQVATALSHTGETADAGTLRRRVLTRSIYGVDVNPTAVWLCQLRLWLSVVIESRHDDPADVIPLPNLDRNIRVGDSLAGRGFGDDEFRVTGARALQRLRERYVVATGRRKDALSKQLDRAERDRALRSLRAELESVSAQRRDLIVSRRGRDLFGDRYRPSAAEVSLAHALRRRAVALRVAERRLRTGGALPFSFPVHFADVAARGGFDLVVGNPPWVRLHRITSAQRAEVRREYAVARCAAWEAGATIAGAGRGFAAQVDLSALFVERSVKLLTDGGALSLLLPVKLWRSLAGGGVRRLLVEETCIRRVVDASEARAAFDAAVYPSLIVASRVADPGKAVRDAVVTVHAKEGPGLEWTQSITSLALDGSHDGPWILLPPPARESFDRLRRLGQPLAASPIGRPRLGVKCGCNDAFVVTVLETSGTVAEIRDGTGHRAEIEAHLLRPLLRGETLSRWHSASADEHIIWTHDVTGSPLASLPPLASRWFARRRRELSARADARHAARFWSLFRIDAAAMDRPRVVWADIGREPRACPVDTGSAIVPLNTCYVARCRDRTDALALTALLNGPVARSWLNAAAEPARGGYRRYLGWTLSLLPVPATWSRARDILAPLGDRALGGKLPTDAELIEASARAYGIRCDALAPLVAWMSGR